MRTAGQVALVLLALLAGFAATYSTTRFLDGPARHTVPPVDLDDLPASSGAPTTTSTAPVPTTTAPGPTATAPPTPPVTAATVPPATAPPAVPPSQVDDDDDDDDDLDDLDDERDDDG